MANGTGRLTGWKAIAAHLGVDVRTARRWEEERGLPVRRLPGDNRSPVWADPRELDSWMRDPSVERSAAEPPRLPPAPMPLVDQPGEIRRRGWSVLAIGAVVVALAVLFLLPGRQAPPVAAHAVPFADDASNQLWNQATHAKASRTPTGLDEAASAFAELSRRHPRSPAPRVGLAETYLLMREFAGLSDEAAFRRARDAAEAALRLDPGNPDALRALGFILFWSETHKPKGLDLLQQAAESGAATDARAWHWYGNALAFDGRPQEALKVLSRARSLAPESSAIAADEAQVRYILGEKAPALAALHAITRSDPAFIGAWRYLEWDLLAERDAAGFLKAARVHARLRRDTDRLVLLDRAERALAAGGRAALLDILLADAEQQFQASGEGALAIARLQALVGNQSETRRWIERARALDEPFAYMLDGWPELRPLRQSPELADLFTRRPA